MHNDPTRNYLVKLANANGLNGTLAELDYVLVMTVQNVKRLSKTGDFRDRNTVVVVMHIQKNLHSMVTKVNQVQEL